MKIAIIGATGDMGYGLAMRLAQKGHEIIIGSRDAEKAQQAAEKATNECGVKLIGLSNEDACSGCDLVVISVPAAGHRPTLEALRDKIGSVPVLDITIPMAFKPLRYDPPAEGSNALETLALLGEETKVAAGFHTISAQLLCDLEHPVLGDLLVVGNDDALVEAILELGAQMGLRAFHAGGLENASTVEAITPMLIGMNRRYKKRHIGIEICGI